MTYRIPWLYGILLMPLLIVVFTLLCAIVTALCPLLVAVAALTGNLTYTVNK